jgi:hypothetical protein
LILLKVLEIINGIKKKLNEQLFKDNISLVIPLIFLLVLEITNRTKKANEQLSKDDFPLAIPSIISNNNKILSKYSFSIP